MKCQLRWGQAQLFPEARQPGGPRRYRVFDCSTWGPATTSLALATAQARDAGVAWRPVMNGYADVDGVPDEVIRAFSKRSDEIEDLVAESGYTSARARQTATLATRKPKDHSLTPATLADRWRDEAVEFGFGPEAVNACFGRTRPAPVSSETTERFFDRLAGPDGLTRQASTFTRREVVESLATALSVDGHRLAGDLDHGAHDPKPSGLDTVTAALEQRQARSLAHEADTFAAARVDDRHRDLRSLRVEREALEDVLAAAPSSSAETLLAARRHRDALLARRHLWETRLARSDERHGDNGPSLESDGRYRHAAARDRPRQQGPERYRGADRTPRGSPSRPGCLPRRPRHRPRRRPLGPVTSQDVRDPPGEKEVDERMSRTEEPADSVLVRHAIEDERQQLMLAVARLEGEIAALQDQLAAAQVAAEHHRAELDAARQEAAEAQAAQRADQARLEEIRRTVSDLRKRADDAEEARRRAENERAAVIAALGRKARRVLGEGQSLSRA